MQPPFDIAADLDTPVSAYLKLRPFEPRFLLESVEGGERLGRYSFLGLGEALQVRLGATGLQIGERTLPRPGNGRELLDALREALGQAPRLQPAPDDVPFAGGLVGAAAYDMVRHFERLPAPDPEARGSEAHYIAPRSLLIFDHLSRRVALLHDGPEAERRSLRQEIVAALRGPLPPFGGGGFQPPAASFTAEAFMDAVRRAQEYITAGDVYQLVLSVRYSGQCNLDPFAVYRAMRLLNPSPYLYFCELGEQTIVGSSPEALVRLQGRRAWLRPIAGTRPRGSTRVEDELNERELLADPKENAEHVMLVDLARNDLGRVASHVMHIVSGVKGELEGSADAFDLFAATFPAGTLVGAPKVRAMELIDELEPAPRGFYAGTVGYFGCGGAMDQAIAIRTLIFQGDTYSYQAGAGVVADSVPRAEHAEVLAKSEVLRRALGLAVEGL